MYSSLATTQFLCPLTARVLKRIFYNCCLKFLSPFSLEPVPIILGLHHSLNQLCQCHQLPLHCSWFLTSAASQRKSETIPHTQRGRTDRGKRQTPLDWQVAGLIRKRMCKACPGQPQDEQISALSLQNLKGLYVKSSVTHSVQMVSATPYSLRAASSERLLVWEQWAEVHSREGTTLCLGPALWSNSGHILSILVKCLLPEDGSL